MQIAINNSRTATPEPHSQTVAGYVYQGAAILAALLVVFSSAI